MNLQFFLTVFLLRYIHLATHQKEHNTLLQSSYPSLHKVVKYLIVQEYILLLFLDDSINLSLYENDLMLLNKIQVLSCPNMQHLYQFDFFQLDNHLVFSEQYQLIYLSTLLKCQLIQNRVLPVYLILVLYIH